MDLIPNAVDAAAVATDAIDADALATDAVNEVRDAILSDSTPFDGADIAAILNDTGITIPALIAGIASDVWDELASSHQVIGRMGAIYTRLIGKFITNPSTGVNTIRDLGDTGDFVTADIFEDVAESQQYQDQGINVRDEYT
ncbi:MAG: hypothetical protein GY906_10450 [bacterium]|nr:hypothetical protein [bacterium]